MNPPHEQVRLLVLIALLLGCGLIERLRPLRRPTQPRGPRWFHNILIALSSALILKIAFTPLVLIVSDVVTARKWGLFAMMDLPPYVRWPLMLLALDYTLYLWHQLMHRVRWLWRFHNVHHVDLDLDTTTALRFHFGELSLSAFYRSAQVVLLGANAWELIIFELCVTSFAQFHHSNMRLPLPVERIFGWLLIMPRMHGIHHSIVRTETDSNFGTILSVWDRSHGTLETQVPQHAITIGVPGYRDPSELTFIRSLWLPFQKQRRWELPDGRVPVRAEPEA